jgi:hypothetical protein
LGADGWLDGAAGFGALAGGFLLSKLKAGKARTISTRQYLAIVFPVPLLKFTPPPKD